MDKLNQNHTKEFDQAIENLQYIIAEYAEEERNVRFEIDQNQDRISEAERYLNSLYEKEDIDVKIFSPRNIEDKYKSEILDSKKQIHDLEVTNQELYKRLNRILDKQTKLKTVNEQLQEGSHSVNTEESESNIAIVLELQENDKKRIASDLHDITVQELVHIIQKTELCMKYLNQDPNRVNLELASTIQLLRSSIQNIRNIIYDLRPMSFDDFGFSEAVRRLAEDMMNNSHFMIQADVDEFDDRNENEFLSLYRSISELVRNSIYHSEGTKIDISVKKIDGQIVVHVKDDGKGYDPERLDNSNQNHFGLHIIKNRIDLLDGKLLIESNEKGTDVEIIVKDWTCTDDRDNVG